MVKDINLLSKKIISTNLGESEVIELLLENRNVTDVDNFLSPPFPHIDLELDKAVSIIKESIDKKQYILIYGDYDVDGITSTAILWQAIFLKHKNVIPFIPHRQTDGYGVKAASFFRLQKEKNIKFDLLITVDNGIVAQSELLKIKSKQDIKIIVTDHHVSAGSITSADAIVASTELCGAAISYFLSSQITTSADLGLAALGTVADCLPLTGVNRSIVVHGLKKLNLDPSPGIKKLSQVSSLKNTLSTYELGYVLGPRINAIGRLSDPTDALRLLCSQNEDQAAKYAQALNEYNRSRQDIQKESLDIADQDIDLENKIIVVDGPYNPGIIGLISGRLTEKYYLPSIIIAVDGDLAKGSCRSIPELNIITTLRRFSKLFIDLGGHSGAAGFSIKTSNIPKLKKLLTDYVNKALKKTKLQPHLDVDAIMDITSVSQKLIESLQQLAPFGIGNPEPLFLFKNLTIDSIRAIGQNMDHLKLRLSGVDAIAFKKAELSGRIKSGDIIDVVASLSINTWNNTSSPQLIVKEIIKV